MSTLLQVTEQPKYLKTSKPLQERGMSGRGAGQGWRSPGASPVPRHPAAQRHPFDALILY